MYSFKRFNNNDISTTATAAAKTFSWAGHELVDNGIFSYLFKNTLGPFYRDANLLSLGFGPTFDEACTESIANPGEYYTNRLPFTSATNIYTDRDLTTLADPGYYSDGSDWRYWNGLEFTTSGDCGIYGA